MAYDVRRLDIYRKIPKDLSQPTFTGAIISICCSLFIIFLLLSELKFFISTNIVSELYVDSHKEKDNRIAVRLNISLIRLNCDILGLDIQDDMGRHEVGFAEDTEKIQIYDGEGCRFQGRFFINKVPGNFHISTHAAGFQDEIPDMSHIIHEVSFGEQITYDKLKSRGSFNSLIGYNKSDVNSLSSHDYVMKVVPTIFENLDGVQIYSYQYTYAYKDYVAIGHGHSIIPAIWFRYDLSPITVKYIETRQPFYSFLTTVCAMVGGTFTVAGIVDACIFSAHEIYRKAQLGKLS